jgi:triacylglycerol lipase
MDKIIKLKYPLVLVHGIAATEKAKLIKFWGRIPKILEKAGVNVNYGNTDSWASLTTICTPHLGSEIAGYLMDKDIVRHKLARIIVGLLSYVYGDLSPDPIKLLRELTTGSMKEFNKSNPDIPGIYYQSLYSVLQDQFDDVSFYHSYLLLLDMAGANDGIISRKSTCWGKNHRLLSGKRKGISHAEIIDFKQRKISGVNIPEIYLGIVSDLASRGV